jgi:predicted O-methyltransferase YrrM
MSNQTLPLTPELYQYLLRVSLRESPALRALREHTAGHAMARMQIAPEQGQFMALLVKLLGARRCLEIGVFTGYSALAIAAALPESGELVACELNADYARIALRHWQAAGVEERIQLRLGPARESLDALLAQGDAGSFDFAFIDADKPSYTEYYERSLELLRPGGLIAVDNALWGGRVSDDKEQDEDTRAIRAFNEQVSGDERVDISLVPIGDGVMLARKR